MDQYIGTKNINAKPMSRLEYNHFRGWTCPLDENGADEGYLVEYLNGDCQNTDAYEGYVSWSPKDVFEQAYKRTDGMTFGLAVEALKKGRLVARKGWNGKDMFLFLVAGSTFNVNRAPLLGIYNVNRAPLLGIYPEGTEIKYLPHIDMKTATGEIVPWLASQSDVLADDWFHMKLVPAS